MNNSFNLMRQTYDGMARTSICPRWRFMDWAHRESDSGCFYARPNRLRLFLSLFVMAFIA